MNRNSTLVILLLVLFSIKSEFVNAQNEALKFGKIPDELVAMKSYDKDPEAEALVLSHYGETKFTFNASNGFVINYKIHKVVKVLSQDGVRFADMTIPYYNISGRTDKVFNVKGFVYNASEDGKVTKEKLGKENIFDEKASSVFHLTKISMPNVKAGSIIEISYEINSDLYNYMREWEFQDEIPTLWSEYKLEHPEYFSYSQISQGGSPYSINSKSTAAGRVNWVSSERVNNRYTVTNETTTNAVDFTNHLYHWAAANVPALRPEPYVDNPRSYATKVEFQLKHIQFPNSARQNVAPSWELMSEELLVDEDFGRLLGRVKFAKDIVPSLIQNSSTDEEKIAAIMDHISSKVVWNSKRGIYPTKSLEKVYEEGNGSVADINFILIAFLREAGLNANPIVSSTRDIGFLNPTNPLMYKLNYVTAAVKLNDKEIVLDATDGSLPVGMTPTHVINLNGWVVSDQNSHWIDMKNLNPISETSMINISIDQDKLLVDVSKRIVGYKAAQLKKSLSKNGEDKFLIEFEDMFKDWEVIDASFENAENRHLPFVEKYKLSGNSGLELSGDYIYLNVFDDLYLSENPFKQDSRQFPIDFVYGRKNNVIMFIDVPEGFAVEELPQSSVSYFEEKDIVFSYMSSIQANGKIQINFIYQVNQTFFRPDKYDQLKEFYSAISAKQKQMIVFKKIAE
ncbi:DUF3857 domain-containing protein [Belliella sp. R4-6]|uniref:DUF3857 domain-containing protein n=1 Tax=Belliella alkalica TaxID=1730871 RepID=A0ABS9V811_9BACT|nr:DUF3857 domain-containing protein [Belliella alkalica]MCH7412559.1 DUF3857 domain-containing protein [Belliella alkalica]